MLFREREGHSLLHVVSGTWAASTRLVCAPLVPAPASSLATLPALIMVSPLPQSRTGHWTLPYLSCDMLSCPDPVAMEYKGPQILHALSHILQTL